MLWTQFRSGALAVSGADTVPSLMGEDEGQKTQRETKQKVAQRPGVPCRDLGLLLQRPTLL